MLSICGCYQFLSSNGDKVIVTSGTERGTYGAPTLEENVNPQGKLKSSVHQDEHYIRQIADFWGSAFQIIYQMVLSSQASETARSLLNTGLDDAKLMLIKKL